MKKERSGIESSNKTKEKEEFSLKENFLKNRLKEKKGITLIALVVTIIVLLILARDSNINAFW